MNQLKVIDQRTVLDQDFKMYGTFEEPLFLAKDVAEWIDYDTTSVNKMLAAVDGDEKARKIVPTLGGNQKSWFLTENGLYEVLVQSRKPIAKQFKSEVKKILKSLRTGKAKLVGMTDVRKWLVAIREERGLPQKYVAEQARISQPSYCNIENGERRPAVKTAKAIATVLDFDWTRFYEESGKDDDHHERHCG